MLLIFYKLKVEENFLRHIPSNQYGFKEGHSTTNAILRLQASAIKAISKRRMLGAIFVDLRKAYDTVSREKLLQMLKEVVKNEKTMGFLEFYLGERTCGVKRDSGEVIWFLSLKGVPQGSPLSPLLFNFYIRELLVNKYTSIIGYADDLALFHEGKTVNSARSVLQIGLNHLKEKCDNLKLEISIGKTKSMKFGHKREPLKIYIGSEKLEETKSFKYLGVSLDSRLSFKNHISDVKNRALYTLNAYIALSNKFNGINAKNLITVAKTHVIPIIDYGAMSTICASKTQKERLNKVINKAAARALGVSGRGSAKNLRFLAGLKDVESRWLSLTEKHWGKIKLNDPNTAKHIENTVTNKTYEEKNPITFIVKSQKKREAPTLDAPNNKMVQIMKQYVDSKLWPDLSRLEESRFFKTLLSENKSSKFKRLMGKNDPLQCTLCNTTNEEFHIIFECKKHKTLRDILLGLQGTSDTKRALKVFKLNSKQLAKFVMRLFLPLNNKVHRTSGSRSLHPSNSPRHSIGRSDGRCVQRAGT